MRMKMNADQLDQLTSQLVLLWDDPQEREQLAQALRALDLRYELTRKMAREPGVAEILAQMLGRLAAAYQKLSDLRGRKILDIACGSNTSKFPGSIRVNTPFGVKTIGRPSKNYTALFEPWFCRILLELGADPVGVDKGDLEAEAFTHYRVDLGQDRCAGLPAGPFLRCHPGQPPVRLARVHRPVPPRSRPFEGCR